MPLLLYSKAQVALMWFFMLLSLQTSWLSVLAAEPVADQTAYPHHHARQVIHHGYHWDGIPPRSPTPDALPPPIRPPPPSPPPTEQKDADDASSHLTCSPFGECEPCPLESLDEPFCRPFGNRRLMHCVNTTTSSPLRPPPPPSPLIPGSNERTPQPQHNPLDASSQNEGSKIPAWESCGRIPKQERADFLEFVACNAAFVILSLAVVLWRSRVVRVRQARVLAARIGIGGGRGRRA